MSSVNIIPSGGLLTHQFIEAIQQPSYNHTAAHPESFTLPARKPPSAAELENTIGSAWELLVERWDSIEKDIRTFDISTLRTRWLRPLMDLLDFSLEYQRADLIIDSLRFPISHMALPANAGDCPVPCHSVLPDGPETLDTRPNSGSGIKRLAPHDILQRYLNMAHAHHWGIVTDGLRLRLLRDYHHTYTRGFVEFDLERIFSGRDFAAFRALFRLCHASRFVPIETDQPEDASEEPEDASETKTPLDKFYESALAAGIEVGDKLRQSVLKAIEAFGNGFLQATPGLLSRFQQQELDVNDFYDDVLHVIYRILFILFAEQRGMLPGRGSLYMDTYSLTALRRIAERPIGEDRHLDLWEQLKTTFSMVEHGVPLLDIFGYNGALFASRKTPILTPPENAPQPPPRLRNDALLTAIRDLTTIEEEGVRQRISYMDLSVEEMGSVYESLLDFTPRIASAAEVVDSREIPAGAFFLDPRGKERKTTGSYYTNPALVNELIRSALVPVLEERLASAVPEYDPDHPESLNEQEKAATEEALLDLKVLDPASGSGAFLIAANNTLGLRLAQIRAGDLYPPEKLIRTARRDVLAHCIYGVDLNPMAVELCKVSLWINAAVEDKKLNFLDHHIKPGNSLVGIGPNLPVRLENEVLLDFSQLEIPNEAYDPLSMDDKTIARAARDRNKAEIKLRQKNARQPVLWQVTSLFHSPEQSYSEITELGLSDPEEAEKRYQNWAEAELYQLSRFAADLWTAAFFWHYDEATANRLEPPTEARFRLACEEGPRAFEKEFINEVNTLREDYNFFHWHLEFPGAFLKNKGVENYGFDIVIGNPPWERLQFEEQMFFEFLSPDIYIETSQRSRRRKIQNLRSSNPNLFNQWKQAKRIIESQYRFLRHSTRFPLSAFDKFNLYAVFTEFAVNTYFPIGRAGIIVKGGYITDKLCANLFAYHMKNKIIESAIEFENKNKLFSQVHRQERFVLLTLGNNVPEANFIFDNTTLEDAKSQDRYIKMSYHDIELLSPNTKNCPKFSNRYHYKIAKKGYSLGEILIRKDQEINVWNISIDRYINVSDYSDKIEVNPDINLNVPPHFSQNQPLIPLYEGKLFHQYDHRYATYDSNSVTQYLLEKKPKTYINCLRYIPPNEATNRNPALINSSGLLCIRDITNRTNERGAIATIIPNNITDYTVRVIPLPERELDAILLLSDINSFTFDFLIRQRIGGTHLSNYIIEQSPVIHPHVLYSHRIIHFIIPRVYELIYTSWDIKPFIDNTWGQIINLNFETSIIEYIKKLSLVDSAQITKPTPPSWLSVLYNDKPSNPFPYPPFMWDEERRAQLRADLDGLYGHLYGLHRDELAYILDTFPIVQRRDEEQFGEYRTKRLVLEAYDRLADSDLIPEEARQQSQTSVLDAPEVHPAAKPASAKKAPPDPPPAKGDTKKAVESTTAEARGKADPPPAEEPAPSDYGLYKCQGCGKIVVGFDKPTHTQKKHAGQDPGYQKMS